MIKINTDRYWSVDAACFSDNCVDLCFLMLSNYNRINRPFPSWTISLFQSEAKCDSIGMKMIFYSHANKTPFESESFWTLEMAFCLLFHWKKKEEFWPQAMGVNRMTIQSRPLSNVPTTEGLVTLSVAPHFVDTSLIGKILFSPRERWFLRFVACLVPGSSFTLASTLRPRDHRAPTRVLIEQLRLQPRTSAPNGLIAPDRNTRSGHKLRKIDAITIKMLM